MAPMKQGRNKGKNKGKNTLLVRPATGLFLVIVFIMMSSASVAESAPGAPPVASSTHPSQYNWYASNDPVLRLVGPVETTATATLNTSSAAMDLVVAGYYAYVADWEAGLQIIDVSNPVAPVKVGALDTTGLAVGIAVSGNYVFLADGASGLLIIDVTDKLHPALVSATAVGPTQDVAVSGNYAYVTTGSGGLQIVDVTDKLHPGIVGTHDTPALALGIAVSGNYAYVADYWTLQIIDVGNPSSPALAGAFDAVGSARDVTLRGDYAYVADEAGGLYIADVSDPSQPAQVGVFDTPSVGVSVDVLGDHAFVADYSSVQVIDVSEPQSPAWAADYTGVSSVMKVDAVGNYAYVADQGLGLVILSFETPTGFSYVFDGLGGTVPDEVSEGISTTVSYADVADGEWFFHARALNANGWGATNNVRVRVDTVPHESPAVSSSTHSSQDTWYATNDAGFSWDRYQDATRVASYDTTGFSYGVEVVADYAYVADGASGLQVFDVTARSKPARLGSLDTNGTSYGLKVVGGTVYLADGASGLRIVDVADPSNPAQVGTYNTTGSAWDVDVVGTTAFVADEYSGLKVLDISDPQNPLHVGAYDTTGAAYDVDVIGNYAYVADWTNGLLIMNVADPAQPTLVGSYDTTGTANSVDVVGNYAYMADWTSGVDIIDISDKSRPTLAGSYNTPGTSWWLEVSGPYVFVADGSNGLVVLDASDPTSPKRAGGLDTTGAAQGIDYYDGHAFLGDKNSGLQIIRLDAPGGYSFEFDQNPLTVPDEISEGMATAASYGNRTDGEWYMHVRAMDSAGNWSQPTHRRARIDTTPPSGTLLIDGGNTYTASTTVVAGSDITGAAQMRFQPDVTWTTWETYTASRELTLTSADGTKTVRAQYRDEAGNILELSDTIILSALGDAWPPTEPTVDSSTHPSGSVWYPNRQVRLSWTASDTDSGIGGYSYVLDEWPTTTPDDTSEGIGTQTLYWIGVDSFSYFHIKARDGAGNWGSTTHREVLVDGTPPSGTMSLVPVLLWDSYEHTRSNTVTVESSVTDPISDIAGMRLNAGDGWGPWESYSPSRLLALPGEDGLKVVSVQYRDAADNIVELIDSITLDTDAPSGDVLLNGGDDSTNDPRVMAGLHVVGADQMMWDAGSGLEVGPFSSALVLDLPPGDGNKHVDFYFLDAAGNVLATSADIMLDTAGPVGTLSLAGGAEYTRSTTVAAHSGVTDAVDMRFNPGGGWTAWEPYGPSKDLSLTAGDGTKFVWARYRDQAGNILELFDYIIRDTDPPEAPTGFAVAPHNTYVTLSWKNPVVDFAAWRLFISNFGFATAAEDTQSPGQMHLFDGTSDTTLVGGLTNGAEYFFTLFARDGAGNWSPAIGATVTPVAPTYFDNEAVVKGSVAYGAPAKFSARLFADPPGGLVTTGEAVVLEGRSGSSAGWTVEASVGDGTVVFNRATYTFEATRVITAKRYYRFRLLSDNAAYLPSISDEVLVYSKASMSTPFLLGSAPVRYRAFTVAAGLQPAHQTLASGSTKFYLWLKVGAKWVPKKNVPAVYKTIGGQKRIAATVKLPAGKWRVKAKHLDGDHLESWSPKKEFMVR